MREEDYNRMNDKLMKLLDKNNQALANAWFMFWAFALAAVGLVAVAVWFQEWWVFIPSVFFWVAAFLASRTIDSAQRLRRALTWDLRDLDGL